VCCVKSRLKRVTRRGLDGVKCSELSGETEGSRDRTRGSDDKNSQQKESRGACRRPGTSTRGRRENENSVRDTRPAAVFNPFAYLHLGPAFSHRRDRARDCAIGGPRFIGRRTPPSARALARAKTAVVCSIDRARSSAASISTNAMPELELDFVIRRSIKKPSRRSWLEQKPEYPARPGITLTPKSPPPGHTLVFDGNHDVLDLIKAPRQI
jgi:hypothetical protein